MSKAGAVDLSQSFAADNTSGAVKSQCKTLDRSKKLDGSNVVQLLPIDSAEFKAWFAQIFAKWLHAYFANPEQVAFGFSVRNSTAWNWWNGDNCASGDAVARAFLMFPDAVAWFLAEWEAR